MPWVVGAVLTLPLLRRARVQRARKSPNETVLYRPRRRDVVKDRTPPGHLVRAVSATSLPSPESVLGRTVLTSTCESRVLRQALATRLVTLAPAMEKDRADGKPGPRLRNEGSPVGAVTRRQSLASSLLKGSANPGTSARMGTHRRRPLSLKHHGVTPLADNRRDGIRVVLLPLLRLRPKRQRHAFFPRRVMC